MMHLLVMQVPSPHMGPLHSSLSGLDAQRHWAAAIFLCSHCRAEEGHQIHHQSPCNPGHLQGTCREGALEDRCKSDALLAHLVSASLVHYHDGVNAFSALAATCLAAETRFYGSFIVAERMIELKEAVQQTVVSSQFSNWTGSQNAKVKEEAAAVKAICLNEEGFWKKEAQLVEIFAPIVKLLRLIDSNLPALSKVSCNLWLDSCQLNPASAQSCLPMARIHMLSLCFRYTSIAACSRTMWMAPASTRARRLLSITACGSAGTTCTMICMAQHFAWTQSSGI